MNRRSFITILAGASALAFTPVLAWNTNRLGAYWRVPTLEDFANIKYYDRIYGKVLIVEDPKYPTMVVK